MSITAYRDEGYGALEIGNDSGAYSCFCGHEFEADEMHANSITYGPGGHRVVEVGEECKHCGADTDTKTVLVTEGHDNLDLLFLEWLSSAAGSRIVWKVENYESLPTSWSCVIADVPQEWAATSAEKPAQNRFPYMELRRKAFSNYAFAVVPDTTEDSFSTFRAHQASWTYFEDWLERERGLQLSQLLGQ